MEKLNLYIVPGIVYKSLKRNSFNINDFLNLDKIKNILSLEQLTISYILNTIGINLDKNILFSDLNNDFVDIWKEKDSELLNIIEKRSEIESKLINIKNFISLEIDSEEKKFEIIMNDNNIFIILFSKIFENESESTIDVINRSIVEYLYNKVSFSNLASTAIFKQYFKSL